MKKKVIRIEVSPPSPESVAMEIVMNEYGHFCSPGKPRREGDKVIVPIMADAPVRRMKEVLEYESLGEVAHIEVDPKTMKATNYPTLDELLAIMEDKLKEKSES